MKPKYPVSGRISGAPIRHIRYPAGSQKSRSGASLLTTIFQTQFTKSPYRDLPDQISDVSMLEHFRNRNFGRHRCVHPICVSCAFSFLHCKCFLGIRSALFLEIAALFFPIAKNKSNALNHHFRLASRQAPTPTRRGPLTPLETTETFQSPNPGQI